MVPPNSGPTIAEQCFGDATVSPELDWTHARQSLSGPGNAGMNIAYAAVDRHVAAGRGVARPFSAWADAMKSVA